MTGLDRRFLPALAALLILSAPAAQSQSVTEQYRATADKIIQSALSDSAAWNRIAELTEKFGLKPLDWDARGDSIYHPFDLSGRRHMEYLCYRGVFADIPFEEIRGAFRHYYPRMTKLQEAMEIGGQLGGGEAGGDFGAEGEAEAKQK